MKRVLAAAIAALVATTACSRDEYRNSRGRGDASVGEIDDERARIVNFPDRFHNIAFKCLGPNGIYAHTRDAAPIVVPDDANCDEPLDGAG